MTTQRQRSGRRAFLRAALAALPAGLTVACSNSIGPARLPKSPAKARVVVLAAHAASSAGGQAVPAWVEAARGAVEGLNTHPQPGVRLPPLDFGVFGADQAAGARTVGSSGQPFFNNDAYVDALAQRLTDGVDVLLFNATFPPGALVSLHQRRVLTSLAPLLAHERRQPTDYYPSALLLGRVQGEQLVLPLAVLPQLLRFDAAMLRAAGLGVPPPAQPWPWQQLIDAAQVLAGRARGRAVPQWLCDVTTLAPEIPIWQAGGEVIDVNDAVLLDQPAAIQGVTCWRDLVTRDRLVVPQSGVGAVPKDPARPYAIRAWGGYAASTFATPADADSPDLAAIATSWDVGLGFAPIPVGLPGGITPVTKIELQVGAGISASSRQPEAALAVLRALEAAVGPSLLVSARQPLAMKMLEQGRLDARLASAIAWGMQVGRASAADQVGVGSLLGGLRDVFPGYQHATGADPATACSAVAQALRARLSAMSSQAG
jgi:hypothetical protein